MFECPVITLINISLCIVVDVSSPFFQDTLIVWSEADNYDLALSFQEKAGCDEIWEKICEVRIIQYSYIYNFVLC